MYISKKNSIYWHRLKRYLFTHIWVARGVIIAGLGVTLCLGAWFLLKPVQQLMSDLWTGPKMVTTFFSDPLFTLPSYEGRTNILFLGMGGGDHSGAELTDTILFVALDLKQTEVTMLSIPRDVWVPSLEAKINAAYAFGEQQATGSGYALIEDAVYEITDQPIHYIVRLDFIGFQHIVDALGGVDVLVDQAFTDPKYPVKGKERDECSGDLTYACRYEALHFDKGLQRMNGETALKFVRSRQAVGDEGTDFARSQRQQKVLQAIRNKISSKEILLSPKKLLEMKDIIFRYLIIHPSISNEEYAGFASFGVAFWRSSKEIKSLTLATGDEDNPGFLMNPPIEKYNQWVLEPRLGSWDEFRSYFRQLLQTER